VRYKSVSDNAKLSKASPPVPQGRRGIGPNRADSEIALSLRQQRDPYFTFTVTTLEYADTCPVVWL
jgi:hypothetical protein